MAKLRVTMVMVVDSENYLGTPEEYKKHLEEILYIRKLPSDADVDDFDVIKVEILKGGA